MVDGSGFEGSGFRALLRVNFVFDSYVTACRVWGLGFRVEACRLVKGLGFHRDRKRAAEDVRAPCCDGEKSGLNGCKKRGLNGCLEKKGLNGCRGCALL